MEQFLLNLKITSFEQIILHHEFAITLLRSSEMYNCGRPMSLASYILLYVTMQVIVKDVLFKLPSFWYAFLNSYLFFIT